MDPRLEVKSSILTCTSCNLHKSLGGPVPFQGPVDTRFAAIQSSPNTGASRAQSQFDPESKLVWETSLADSGLSVDPCVFSLTSCVTVGMMGKKQSPAQKTIRACKKNFTAQMRLVDPTWILILDSATLHYFRPEYHWTPMKGVPFLLQGDRIAMCVDHPNNVARNMPNSLVEDLSYFSYLMSLDRSKVVDAFPQYCPCGALGSPRKPDGIVYCKRCCGELKEKVQAL